jgi:hypothetical protein
VDLPDGQYVDLVDRLNHAQMRRIRRAAGDDELDGLTEGVAAMVTGWSLKDVEGTVVPFPTLGVDGVPSGALDTLPADLMLIVGVEALTIANGAPDPKGSGGASPPSRRSAKGRYRLSSPTPTSLPIIPAGPGKHFSPRPGN